MDQQSQEDTETMSSLLPDHLVYSPALLLEATFDAAITEHEDFAKACEDSFHVYFEDQEEEACPFTIQQVRAI